MAIHVSLYSCCSRTKQLLWLEGGLQTSNASPPLPMMLLRPFTKSAVGPESSSRLLVQSSFPVARSTCSVYGAMVFNNGVLRSMSRSGGAAAHAHVGDGHVSVYGIEGVGGCRRDFVVVKARKPPIEGARSRDRRRRVVDMFVVVEGGGVECLGKLSDRDASADDDAQLRRWRRTRSRRSVIRRRGSSESRISAYDHSIEEKY